MSSHEICLSCGRRVYFSGGHHYSCPKQRTTEAWKARYAGGGHIPTEPSTYHPHHDSEYYRNGVDPILEMTEAEYLGDVGDKG